MGQPADLSPSARDEDDPRRWLDASPLLDLGDPKLRLRVRSIVQLCKSEREKATALYHFVKRLPLVKPMKLRVHTARQVLDAGRGDAPDKATLLVAMLRVAGIPARIRYVTVHGELLRGVAAVRQADRPVLEVWLGGAWQQTDTYIYDAATMAAARQRLKDRGWEWGYGIHVEGRMLWDGTESTFVAGAPDEGNPMMLREVGVFHDPLEYVHSRDSHHVPLLRLWQWNLLSPLINRAWRSLREDPPQAVAVPRKSS